jgi:hypothetical protein
MVFDKRADFKPATTLNAHFIADLFFRSFNTLVSHQPAWGGMGQPKWGVSNCSIIFRCSAH